MNNIEVKKRNDVAKGKKQPITNAFLISDIHIGLGKGSDEWIELHREFFEKFFFPLLEKEKNDGSVVICLGDVFEDRKTTNLAANDLAIDMFEKMCKILPVYVINGNHDMYNGTDNTITSLRSFDNIPNLTIMKEPTLWTIGEKDWKKDCLMIPYQGSVEKETEIVTQNNSADYIFLHSDVKSLKYDNGLAITMGVDVSSSKGMIYAGHIHKRQEQDNMVYVGNPFATKWSDFMNQKGIYRLNFKDDTRKFYPNTVSPVFVNITLEQIQELSDEDLYQLVHHNFAQIVIKGSQTEKLQIQELFDRLNVFYPQKLSYKEIAELSNESADSLNESADEYKDKEIKEIVDELIDALDESESFTKDELKEANSYYINLALSEEQ